MNKITIHISVFSVLMLLFICPLYAFAMDNSSYVESPEKWYCNNDIPTINLSSVESNFNLSGEFKYVVNYNSNEIYLFANFQESTLTESNTGFFFCISNKYKSLEKIKVTKENEVFSDYETQTNFNGGKYFAKNIVGFKLKNKLDINTKTNVEVGIIVGEHSYSITNFSLGKNNYATNKNAIQKGENKSSSAKSKASTTKYSYKYSPEKTKAQNKANNSES